MHLTSDRLTLLALGEPDADATDHLTGCEDCRAEFDTLVTVTGLAREGRDLRTLPPPPDRVWDRIAVAAKVHDPAPAVPSRPPVRPATTRRLSLVALAAVLIGILGTLGVLALVQGDSAQVTGQATLTAYGTTPAAAHGEAQVLRETDGYALRIRVADLPPSQGYYEVWLIDPDTSRMFSIGVLDGQSTVVLPLPASADLGRYRLVDVSAEPYDGNATHSGQSLLRGSLTF